MKIEVFDDIIGSKLLCNNTKVVEKHESKG